MDKYLRIPKEKYFYKKRHLFNNSKNTSMDLITSITVSIILIHFCISKYDKGSNFEKHKN